MSIAVRRAAAELFAPRICCFSPLPPARRNGHLRQCPLSPWTPAPLVQPKYHLYHHSHVPHPPCMLPPFPIAPVAVIAAMYTTTVFSWIPPALLPTCGWMHPWQDVHYHRRD
ncbi:hypothetical protein B0H19DRAFT_1266974 [Mycena capillaripes]|nr:hypothetical protein B0H19DRAFT_1266974 [Mycena capillaripes]